jgi:RNA polymerase sigma-70 factor (sigma-E family)
MPDASTAVEFAEFARARTPTLLRSAYLLTGDQFLAEDLVQTALARALRNWQRLDSPEAYTRTVMYHLQIRWWRIRSRRNRADALGGARPEPVMDNTAPIARQLALQQALLALAPKQRAVIVLRYFEDRSVRETAKLLHCSEGTVKSQTAKALANLRRQLPHTDNFAQWSLV